jgi:hypothetical protein
MRHLDLAEGEGTRQPTLDNEEPSIHRRCQILLVRGPFPYESVRGRRMEQHLLHAAPEHDVLPER